MYKSLLKDASLYSLSTVLARGFSLVTVPIFTRILTPADYGALDLLSYLAVFLPLLFGLALDQALARFYIEAETELEKKRIASTVLFYTTVALLPVAIAGSLAAEKLAEAWLDNQVGPRTVVMAFILVWVHSVFFITNNQLKYMFAAKKYALCNIGHTILSTALSVWFIISLHWGVFGVLLAQTVSLACFTGLSLYYGRSAYAIIFDWERFRSMLHYSLPLVPSTVAFFGMQYVDRYALNELRGLHDVGIYGMGARLASLVFLFLTGFQGAWFPVVIRAYREPGARERFRTVFNYFVFVTSSILVVVSLFGQEMLILLTTESFSQGYIVAPLLIASAILSSIGNYFTYGIQIEKKSRIRLYINIVGFIINIVLNIVFINAFGVIGAALANFVSFLIMAWTGMVVSQRLYYVPYEWNRIVLGLGIALLVSHLVLVSPAGISLQVMLLKLALTVITILVVAKIFKISSPRNIIAALQRAS
jgi:O-antigen/teichoic acid export membrane protein